MNINVERVDDINFIISGTIDNSAIKAKAAALKAQAAEATENAAPADEKFEQQAAGMAFQEFVDAGIKKADIAVDRLLGQPGLKKYENRGDAVYFEVDIAITPEIDTDTDIADIIPAFSKPKADPKAVEAKLADFAAKQSPFTPLEQPRALALGDMAVIDFKGFLNGVPFEGGSAEKFKLNIGSKSFIPGFEEQLIGMEYGEERTITVTFPEAYQSKDLAGKETQFEIKLHEILEQKPVEPDDAFAKQILKDESATLDTLREKFADQITAQELSDLYENVLKPQLVEGLISKFDFTLPNNVVEQEIDAKVREKMQHFSKEEQTEYIKDKAKFLALRDSVREEASNGIKIAMIVEALAKKEGLEVDDQEVMSALAYQAMMTGQDAQALVQYYQENNLMTSAKLGLTEDKLFGQMLGFHK